MGGIVTQSKVRNLEAMTLVAVARCLTGDLTRAALDALRHHFAWDLENEFVTVELSRLIIWDAVELAVRHALRAYDALQLAGVLDLNQRRLRVQLPPLVLLSADAELNAAARAEGAAVDDPTAHP